MRHNGTENSESADIDLTDRQVAALPYLTASTSVSEGARLADIGRATLHRWMHDDDFRRTLERLRSDAADLARTELRGLMLKGAFVLAEAMEDTSPAVRVRAAQAALSLGLKAIDLKELRDRIDLVDQALHLWAGRSTHP